jgi:NAD(P)H-hydrate epimerase
MARHPEWLTTMFTLTSGEPVPAVSTAQMREIDRSMAGYFDIDLARMMENAGRNLADLGQLLFTPQTVIVLAGPGGNGGGGLAAARHLHNRGITVSVVLAGGPLAPVTAQQASTVNRMGILIRQDPTPADLVVDALIGYGLHGDPRGRTGKLVGWASTRPGPVLSLDGPSGLDLDTGRQAVPCVHADATMTLALPKTGLAGAEATGRLYLADISVPQLLYQRMGLAVPALFRHGPVVELHTRPAR